MRRPAVPCGRPTCGRSTRDPSGYCPYHDSESERGDITLPGPSLSWYDEPERISVEIDELDFAVGFGVLSVWIDDHCVGEMTWHTETGEIGNIEVQPEYQRNGIATEMLRRAREESAAHGVAITHSPLRTPEGEAWARATGDALPELVDEDHYTPPPSNFRPRPRDRGDGTGDCTDCYGSVGNERGTLAANPDCTLCGGAGTVPLLSAV